MPDLINAAYGFHHTVDSALDTLGDLGVSAERINIEMAGLGSADRRVVRQQPAPGEDLAGAKVRLWVAGLGYFEGLPSAMRHYRGDEADAGVDDIVRPLDDPIQKAVHWVRQGARLFNIRRDDPRSCARWIELFGLEPAEWHESNRYHLALLLPNLQALAAKEEGVRLAFSLLLGVPVAGLRVRPAFRTIAPRDRSFLGARASRLGVDSVAGDRVEDLGEVRVRVGPVPLEAYYEYHRENKKLVDQTLALVASCDRRWTLDWVVEDPRRAPRLGEAAANSILGLNTHLGEPAPAAAAS